MVNEVSRKKSTVKVKLKATNQEEWIHLWKQNFKNLLRKPPEFRLEPIAKIISNELDFKLGLFMQEELNLVLRKIKNRKAAGIWKISELDDLLLQRCNAIYNQSTIDIWTKGCIFPFPKKGDLRIAKNYQGITLTSIAAKIYNAQLHNCIEPKFEKILRENQNGFQRNRSTTSQILTISQILEGVCAKNLKPGTAINRLSVIWKSDLPDKIKHSFFRSVVVLILLYGCTTWMLSKCMEKNLDGNYTRLLRAILNKSWRQQPIKQQLYGHLPPIMKIIQFRWTRHVGHCWRSKDKLISDILL